MKALLKLFGFKTKTKAQVAFKKYMKQARAMVKLARLNKQEGIQGAFQAAMESAKAFRNAAHASLHYGV